MKNMTTGISIIIPTYNRSDMLRKILVDLIEQSYQEYEIIIVDDKSSDDTQKIIQKLIEKTNIISYYKSNGSGQKNAKKLGMRKSKYEYISILEDDIRIYDTLFLEKISQKLSKNIVVQSKIIMENLGEKNYKKEYFMNQFFKKSFPILELGNFKKNYGSVDRELFPLIECGTFFHISLVEQFIDENLLVDSWGESYSISLKLLLRNVKLIFSADSVIYHIGSQQGGSNKFDKKSLKHGFSVFHYGYFYNSIYLHARFKPWYVFLWLPYFLIKGCVALIMNRDIKRACPYFLKPVLHSMYKNFFTRDFN